MRAKITKRMVDQAEAAERDLWIWDTEVNGFGLRVRPSGRKSYIVEYRPGAGGRKSPKRRYTIGPHGSPWTPDTARKRAIEVLGDVVKGGDPSADRREARQADQENVAHFIEAFIERYAKKQQRSWRETERVLRREVVPKIGKKRLGDVSRRDVAGMIDQVLNRAPVMANRTFAYLRRFFNWCVEQGYLELNPCSGLKPPAAGGHRERVLTDEELAEVWAASEALSPLWERIFKLLMLTAQRKNEVVGLEWGELDLEGRLWRIPGRRTKNGRAHEVPLTPLALELITSSPSVEHQRYVFSTSGTKPLSGQSRVKRQLDSELERRRLDRASGNEVHSFPHWTVHDLRRTATSGMARLGVPPHVADALLNHKSGVVSGVAAVYNRYAYLDERRSALEAWEEHIRSLL